MKKPANPYKRTGKCNNCGLCCLLDWKATEIPRKHSPQTDSDYLAKLRDGWQVARVTKTHIYLARWNPCPHLTLNLRCRLHGKPEQPETCRLWPTSPDGFYQLVKPICSIKFQRRTTR